MRFIKIIIFLERAYLDISCNFFLGIMLLRINIFFKFDLKVFAEVAGSPPWWWKKWFDLIKLVRLYSQIIRNMPKTPENFCSKNGTIWPTCIRTYHKSLEKFCFIFWVIDRLRDSLISLIAIMYNFFVYCFKTSFYVFKIFREQMLSFP